MMSPTPTLIEQRSLTEMNIAWNFGEVFSVPYLEIRFACPCAGCIDEHTGKRILDKSKIAQEIRPKAIHPVGRYAIQIIWSDGHETGIYHYDRLLNICRKFGSTIPK